jgi:hypothetical protein
MPRYWDAEQMLDLYVFACERCSTVTESTRADTRRCRACRRHRSDFEAAYATPYAMRAACGHVAYGKQEMQRCAACAAAAERDRKRLSARRRRASSRASDASSG